MSVCPVCGNNCEDGKRFCSECGSPLTSTRADGNVNNTAYKSWEEYDRLHNKERYQQPQYTAPYAGAAPLGGKGSSIASLVLGILSMALFFTPLLSIPGLITGLVSLSKASRVTAKVGVILSVISLVLFVASVVIVIVSGFDTGSFFSNFNSFGDVV